MSGPHFRESYSTWSGTGNKRHLVETGTARALCGTAMRRRRATGVLGVEKMYTRWDRNPTNQRRRCKRCHEALGKLRSPLDRLADV